MPVGGDNGLVRSIHTKKCKRYRLPGTEVNFWFIGEAPTRSAESVQAFQMFSSSCWADADGAIAPCTLIQGALLFSLSLVAFSAHWFYDVPLYGLFHVPWYTVLAVLLVEPRPACIYFLL